MGATLIIIAAAMVAGLVPLIVGVRRGQLTIGVVAGTVAAGAVIQFDYLVGGAVSALFVVGLLLLPRRVVRRRDGE